MLRSGPIEVLVVDDSDFFLTVVSDKLGSNHDISVLTADGGTAALELLDDESVDCIVSDYEMPEMTGLELYERVEDEYDLPFILLTARGDEQTASRAIGAGVDDYLRKNQVSEQESLELLANRIENVVAQRTAREKYKLLVDNTPEEIAQVRDDGTILAANAAMETSFNATQSELVGQHLSEVLPEDTAEGRIERGRTAITADSAVTFQDTVGIRHFHNIAVPVSRGGETDSFQLISRDITQQKRHERELENRTEELAVINRLVRHDINNDVQLLLGWSEALSGFVEDDGEEYLDRVRDTCSHIDELTSIARDFVESMGDDTGVELRATNLRQVLETEVEKNRRSFEDATISVVGDLPNVSVQANELLSSVFGNLLSNAVRHNDAPDPSVEVEVEERESRVLVRIADDGPGVPEQRRDEIFGKGEMGPESSGTGIGLYLVHTLVEQYGGDVWVENRPVEGLSTDALDADGDGDGNGDDGDDNPRGSVFTVELYKAT
ncbi:response regulator [Halorussus lipolyticus]|uniref:response regulator n=1 Tax=Halorussus lipolyticus TaxID=3034024 RepID=UPI0023E83F2C|nr:response regulator [Halorussus sp. DT80]